MSIGSAGAAARSQYATSMGVVATNSWDPNKLIRQAMDARSAEKQAAMSADATVRAQEISSETALEKVKIQSETDKAEMDARKTIRKAGLIAAAGQLAGQAMIKPIELPKPDTSGMETLISKNETRISGLKTTRAETEAEGYTIFNPVTMQDEVIKPGQTTETALKTKPKSEMTNSELARMPRASEQKPIEQTPTALTPDGSGWGALSSTIRSVESSLDDTAYTTRFGGAQFTIGKDHPRISARTGWGTYSAAAGAYQIMPKTWDTVIQPNLNLPDFSKESQEKAGRYLVQNRGVNPDTRFNTFEEFSAGISKLSPEWAGLPNSAQGTGGYWGQAKTDMQTLYNQYQQYLGN
jgi:muramidase (phage lysozyme)